MNKVIVIFILSLILTGCESLPFVDEINSSEAVIAPQKTTNDDDQYYLKIAKDLFVAKQYQQAIKIAQNLAEKGNAEAQYLFGYLLYYGQGVIADKEQGSKWIKSSADAGYRPAIEALVMIQYGLTPNNKCESPVNISEDVEKIKKEQEENNNKDQRQEEENQSKLTQAHQSLQTASTAKQLSSDKHTVNTGASTSNTIESNNSDSDRGWMRYTIQIVQTSNLEYLKDFYYAFKQQYPEWEDHLITYHSKRQPYAYGIGYNTYDSMDDAKETLIKLKQQFNDDSLWLKPLNKSMPYTFN